MTKRKQMLEENKIDTRYVIQYGGRRYHFKRREILTQEQNKKIIQYL